MLPATRRQATRHLTRAPQRRAYATIDASEVAQRDVPPLVPETSTHPAKQTPAERPVDRRRRPTIYIRASGRLHDMNMADAFSVIRAIERKFGPLREYQFVRDSEQPTAYQSVIFAEFFTHESMDRVKAAGRQVSLKVPLSAPDDVTGPGVGLDQLEGLLEPQGMETFSAASPEKADRVHELDVVIEPTAREHPFRSNAPRTYSQTSYKAFGQAFYKWGGFAELTPLNAAPSPYTEGGAAAPKLPVDDREYMRRALSRWAQDLGRPDPSFPPVPVEPAPSPETIDATTRDASGEGEAQWTPIQDPTSSTPEPISLLDAPLLDSTKQVEESQQVAKPKKSKAPKVSQRERFLAGIRASARLQAEQAAEAGIIDEEGSHSGFSLTSTSSAGYTPGMKSRQREMRESEQAWDATMRSMDQRNAAKSRAPQRKAKEEELASTKDRVFGFIRGFW